MTTSELAYPVILFDKQGYLHVSVDEDWLTTINSATLKHGGCSGWVIVDCKGSTFKIKDTKFVSGKGSFWGYTIFLDRIIRVDHTLDDKPLDMPFEEVKNKVLRQMKRAIHSMDPDYWLGEMRKVKQAQTVGEIVDAILPQYDVRVFFRTLKTGL